MYETLILSTYVNTPSFPSQPFWRYVGQNVTNMLNRFIKTECHINPKKSLNFFNFSQEKKNHLLWQFRFSSRTVISLGSCPCVVMRLGMLRLVPSGKQKPVDIAQGVCPYLGSRGQGHCLFSWRLSVKTKTARVIFFVGGYDWNEPAHDKTYKMACAPSEDSDQPGHLPSQSDQTLRCALTG